MSVWNVFKDRIAFLRCNCVACRKRVQRYGIFLNYQTFCKEIFKDFFKKNNNALNYRELNAIQSFQQVFVKNFVHYYYTLLNK